jgi:8-oxo-dGTP pyrophosphatase MutT (NUDIX family)
MEITRHFTATVLIVHRNRVLLHRHKKWGSLLPVGGHLDRDELPEETAVREAKEEAGLAIELYNPDHTAFSDRRQLVCPMHMLLVNVNEFHQHIDFLFYARAHTDQLAPLNGESDQLYWLTRAEVVAAEMPENVRILALEALDLLGRVEP